MSPADGYKTIAKVTLPQQNKDGEMFPADGNVQGRWQRLTVQMAASLQSVST